MKIGRLLIGLNPPDAWHMDELITKGRGQYRRLWIQGIAKFTLGLGGIVMVGISNEFAEFVGICITAWALSTAILGRLRRAQCYEAGWYEGRTALYHAIVSGRGHENLYRTPSGRILTGRQIERLAEQADRRNGHKGTHRRDTEGGPGSKQP